MLKRRAIVAVAAALLAGCSTFSLDDRDECSQPLDSRGEVTLETRLRGPNCNGDKHAHECAALGAPSAYGVDRGCKDAARPKGDGLCTLRPVNGDCVEFGDIVCCPE